MIDFNLKPESGSWTESRIQLYYLQQIAEKMEVIASELERQGRTGEYLQKEREEHKVTDCALSLMLYKDEITELFSGNDYMPLSIFRNEILAYKRAFAGWIDRQKLVGAIAEVDYLVTEPAGCGYRVRVIRKIEGDGKKWLSQGFTEKEIQPDIV